MDMWVIIVLVLVALVALGFVATAPLMRAREAGALRRAKEALGGEDAVKLSSSRAVGFGTEPVEAGGLRGMGALVASDDAVVFVTWAPQKELRIERSGLITAETQVANIRDAHKALIQVRYNDADHGEVTAGFRLVGAADWLDELGGVAPSGDEESDEQGAEDDA